MRILAFTTAGSGHFLPMVPVLKALSDGGHEVAISAPAHFEGSVIGAGLSPRFSRPDIPPDRLGQIFARMEGLSNEASNRIYMRDVFGALNLEAGLDAARAAIAQSSPDVVVAEEAEVTSRVAAAEAGIPLVHVAIGLQRFADLAAELLSEAIKSRGLKAGAGPRLRITCVPASLDGPGASARLRMSSTPTPAPAAWRGSAEPPLVYMTLGSEAGHMAFFPGLATRLVEQFRGKQVRAVFTTGVEEPVAALRRQAPPNVHIERWIPQDEVLARASATISHGGFGTMMATLAHGLPSINLPLFALDQHWNAARLSEAGAGLVIEKPEAAERLGDYMDAVLGDDRYRAAARRLAAEIAGLPPASEAVPLVEALPR